MASQSSATLAAPLAASLAATSLDPSLEEARSSSARMPTYILTLIVSTLVIAIFFRSILPRIPRFFLRGRLRIKRIGLRGVRGIEWRSKGFSVIRGGASSSASSAAPSRSGTPNRNQSAYGDEAVEEDGLVIRIQRVCLVFRGWRSRSRRRCPSVSRHPGMDSEQEEHWEARKPSSWLTIHIQGVGIRLPRSAQDEEAVNARRAKAKAAEEAEVQEEKRKHEKNEERLRELMKSAPATPASARLPRTPTPSEAPNLPTERNQVPLPAPLAQSLRTLPFYFLRRFVLHIRYKAIPRTCGLVLRALRAQLYIIASSLPAFSSLVDIEVHRMEVYIKEAETVVRMGRVGAEVSMSMISSRHNDCKTEGLAGRSSFSDESPASGLGVSPGRLRDVIAAMPERIGSGAKGAMSYVMAGIPAGRANLRLRFEGVQMFEASLGCTEKSSSSPTQARARATSPPLTPRRKVSAVNRAGSSGHGAGTDEASPPVDGQWLGSRIGVLPSRPLSPPSLKRSNSASVLNTMSTLSLSGWTDRWADWALEPYPNSNFSSDTGWARGAAAHSSAGIPDSARLLSLPGTSRFDLGLLLGPSFSVKAKEAVQVEVGIAEMTVGVNAVVRVLSILEQRKARRVGPVPTAAGAQGVRSSFSKHVVQQRSSVPAAIVRVLGSFSFALPAVHLNFSATPSYGALAADATLKEKHNRLPASLQLSASLHGFHFNVNTSDPSDEMHQKWLGTCGIKGHKSNRSVGNSMRSSLADRFRRPDRRGRATLVEHRRAFVLDVGLASFEAHCGVDGQPPDKGSELLFIGDASFVARSTWTPFGMYPSVRDGENAASLYFQGDPNEQSLVAEAAVGQLRGSTNIDQVAALLAYVSFLKAERAATHSRRGISDPRPPPERVHFHHLPKMALAVEVHDVSYQVNAEKGGSDSMKRSLCIELPQFTAAFHGGYHDVYLGRPEAERKAAWKALREDKLDWCIATKYKSGVGVVCSPQKSDDAPQVSGAQNAPAKKPSNEPMTMEEALQRMKELQITDGKEDGDSPPWAAQKSSASTKAQPPRRLGFARKLSSHSGSDTNLRYHFESSCSLDIFEIYLNLSGEGGGARGISARRRDLRESATRHHVVALRSFEATVIGDVPGFTDPTTDVARLRGSQRTLEVRCSLEDVDVEMWHKAAIETCAHLADVLAKAKTPVDPAMFGTEPKAPTPASQAKDDEPVDIIDKCPTGLAFHVSIGAVIAHLGGPDENCDVHLSRGVGFESKRVVLEYAQRGGSQEKLPHAKLGWGARSALELPEDIRLQADALAARDGKAAVGKISLYEIGLFPILDAAQATRQHLDGTAEQASGDAKREQKAPVRKETPVSPALFSPAVWDFQKLKHQISRTKTSRKRFRQQDRGNFIFWMPYSSTKVTIRPPGAVSTKVGKTADEITIATEQTPLLAFKIELLHTYCLLLAFATLKGMRPKARRPRAEPARQQPQDHPVPAKSKPSFHASFDINDVHVSIALPHDVNLFVHLRRLNFRSTRSEGLSVSWESLMTAVESPKVPATGLWEEAVRLRDWKVTVGSKPEGGEPRTIDVNGDGASVRIPFGYVVNRIIDNASVSFKATKQLVHQFVKGNSDSIIEPLAEEPKRLPTISVNLRILTIEAQDDPMETKLNIIWRAGGDEQRARAERDAAFEAKVGAISAEENSKSKTSLDTRATESIYDVESIVDPAQSQTETYGWPGNPSAKHNVTIDEARERLDTFNSSSWIRRYANAKAEQGRREDVVVRRIHGRYPQHRQPSELPIKMASPTRAAPLIRASFSRVSVDVSRTSFPESKLRDFIHEQGGGIPKDTPFSLMVPMHMLWRMSEWRIELRDYPLPLLHVPPTHSNQPDHLKSWEFEADFCIAEQLGGEESIRHVPVVVVPQATGHPEATEYGMLIPKVAMPVKFYGSPTVKIHSSYPTRFVWGQSIQPTIQDVQRVFDGVTSPPHDPSPRIGFWDKLPLVMHGRFRVQFCGEGDMHLYLKGSRDPYQILGHGAGFVKCWRGAVELRINFPNEDREFFQIISDEYLLAIPDLKDYIDSAATGIASDIKADDSDKKSYDPSFGSSAKRYTKEPDFRKICIKLSNGVRWGAGLRFERTCDDDTCERTPKCSGSPFHRECRFFDFKPHWEVITKTREHFAKIPESERKDSYRGWRSNHIHFSLSIYSPKGGLAGYGEHRRGKGGRDGTTNNLYFSPLAFEHFWAWMALFSSAMSLPIRQGKLFPTAPEQSPKFGRHLGTIKYRFDIAPLFISHVYQQYSSRDWARGVTTLFGVKAKVSVFHVDLHQREQEMTKHRPELGGSKKVLHKPFYEAEVDCTDINLRALGGLFSEPDKRLVSFEAEPDEESEEPSDIFSGDCSIKDRDLDWVDMNDFVELDWAPPEESEPKIKLLQALACPRFDYYRRIDSRRERKARNSDAERADGKQDTEDLEDEEGDEQSEMERSKFGNELSHTCLVGQATPIFAIQRELAEGRIRVLQAELDALEHSRDAQQPTADNAAEKSFESTRPAENAEKTPSPHENALRMADLRKKIELIRRYINVLRETGARAAENNPNKPGLGAFTVLDKEWTGVSGHKPLMTLYRDWEKFDNRYFAHNPTIFLSNSTRDVLLKYYLLSRTRKGFAYHMTARAIKYIRDLSKSPKEERPRNHRSKGSQHSKAQSSEHEDGSNLLYGLLHDTMQYVMPESPNVDEWSPGSDSSAADEDPKDGISDEFSIRRTNVCVLLKPQIVLRSDIDEHSTVIITAIRARLQNYRVSDDTCPEDYVNSRVMYRNYLSLDSLQAFQPSKECRFLESARHGSGFVYVPLETFIDLRYETRDFDRIVPQTDATMHYDKFNKLRLYDTTRQVAASGAPDSVADHLRHHMDLIRARCPRFAVSANSVHFAALYNVVTDLLLYRDPAHRAHAKRLEEILFVYEFTEVSELADAVGALQVRIRHARELHDQYQLHFKQLSESGRLDFLALKAELLDLASELNLVVEAITVAQDQKSGTDKDKKSALRLEAQAQDIAWNMMGLDDGELLAKLSVRGVSFTWLHKADNSAANTLSIVDLQALNVTPDAVFVEIIAKHGRAPDHPMAKQGRFLNAMWSVLAPVGGIAIIDQFEWNLHPVRIQLEIRVGRRIMDYIFGSKRERERQRDNTKHLEDEERSPSTNKLLPFSRANGKNESRPEVSVETTPRGSTETRDTRESDTEGDAEKFRPSSRNHVQPMRGSRSSSQHSPKESSTPRSSSSIQVSKSQKGSEGATDHFAYAAKNAAEMRERASMNRTFVYVKIMETTFCLSYKGEKQKSLTDLYDLVFQAPTLEYRNNTWSYLNLVDSFKKDLLRAAWSQRGRLVAGFLKKRDPRKAALNSIRAVRFNQRNEAPSPLQLQVHPATPEGPRSAIDAVPASESREDDSRLTSSDGALDLSSIHPPLAISEGEAQHVIATPETSHHAGDLTTPASSRLSKFFQKISRKRANSGSSSEDAEERGRSKDGSSLARAASASPERSTWTKRERVISESSALAPAAPNGNPSRDIFAQSSNGLRSAPLSVTPALPPIDTSSELLSGRATLAPSPALRSDSSTSDRDRGFISSLSSSLGLSGGGNGGEHPHGHPQRPSSPESVQSARSGGQGSSIKRTLRGYDRGADTHASPRSALVGLSEADKARMLLGDVRHEDE